MPEPLKDKTEPDFSGVAKAYFISLALDEYEDIFSDFDPRSYSERSLSEDFLFELKRAAMNKEEKGLALTLLMPKERRNPAHEKIILERLKTHFRRHHRSLEDQRKKQTRTGAWMIALGVAFMFLASYILSSFKQSLWTSFIVVLLEPAGWFTFWEGLYLIVFTAREAKPDLVFYRKMSGAKITFVSETPAAPPVKPLPG